MATTPTGELVSSSADKTVRVWDADGKPTAKLAAHTGVVYTVVASGGRIYTASGDKPARVWSADGKEIHALPPHKTELYAVAVSPDGKRAATAGKDRVVRLFADGFAAPRR